MIASNANTMTIKEANDLLTYYNVWRRGADTEQPDPKALGEAIDVMTAYVGGTTQMTEEEFLTLTALAAQDYVHRHTDGKGAKPNHTSFFCGALWAWDALNRDTSGGKRTRNDEGGGTEDNTSEGYDGRI